VTINPVEPPVATRPGDAGVAMPLTPAQEDVLQLLRATDQPRPEVDPSLRSELRHRLESGLGGAAATLTAPLFVSKAALGRVLACEAHQVADAAVPFEWSLATARGTVAHKAVQLSISRDDRVPPMAIVDRALERLADDPGERIAGFLLALDDDDRAELRADVHGYLATFLELWPPLLPAWRPQTESPRRAELCGGAIVLSGRVDLTLGAPRGTVAGRVVIDLKTGRRQRVHADDLRFYALLDTLRVGVPPFSLVSYYLDEGEFSVEEVTEQTLEVAVRRTIDGATRLAELAAGLRSPAVVPGPTCRWCRLRDTCPAAITGSDANGSGEPGLDEL
jgi:hypothetical protein